MKRRDQVKMTPEERRRFLAQTKTIILSTIDHRGYPHSVAMWFEMDGDTIVMTTFAKSQKAVNIRRNPKVALMAESGETYDQLKGVLIRGRADVIADAEACAGLLLRVNAVMAGAALAPEAEALLRAQARKRVLIKVTPERFASWDHSKLQGAY
jgi:PPOX class probable F420-dependent enzyme